MALYGLGVELAFQGNREIPVLAWSRALRKMSHVSAPCSPSDLHSWADNPLLSEGPIYVSEKLRCVVVGDAVH